MSDNKKIVTLDEIVFGAEEAEIDVLRDIRLHFPDTRTNKDLLQDKSLKLEWLVDGLLLQGGSSLVVAEPKTGKSVLARQIGYAVSKGTKILNRNVKQGVVFYISVEDHPALIKRHMSNMGSSAEDNIVWSLGRITGISFRDGIEFICKKLRPSLIVVDTMFKVFRTNDINDYNQMIDSLQEVTEIVRKYNSHIMYIHHMNKGGSKKQSLDTAFSTKTSPSLGRIMGSMGIAGEMDNIIILSRDGENRFLNSSYSRCGDKIEDELLYWDSEKEIYLINDI